MEKACEVPPTGHHLFEGDTVDLLKRELPDGVLKTAVLEKFEAECKEFNDGLGIGDNTIPRRSPRVKNSNRFLCKVQECQVS